MRTTRTYSVIGYGERGSHEHARAASRGTAWARFMAEATAKGPHHADVVAAYSTSVQYYVRPDHCRESLSAEQAAQLAAWLQARKG